MGLFVAFEGLDGSGMSTQAAMLSDWFKEKGYISILTKEPTHGLVGGLIKAALKGEWKTSLHSLQLLFTADRGHHLEFEILPALQDGKVVITDRYKYSTMAFGATELPLEWLEQINSQFQEPDLTFFIDTPSHICLERISMSRFGVELFEKEKKLAAVRKVYLGLAKNYGFKVVDGSRTKEQVHKQVVSSVKQFIKDKDVSLQKFL